MNLIVKLYSNMPQDNENVLLGIPGTIPAIVEFNKDTVPDETWQLMAIEEYNAYLNSIKNDLDTWKEIRETVENPI
jgi:hypothetical protein